jgi:hypothetical protein
MRNTYYVPGISPTTLFTEILMTEHKHTDPDAPPENQKEQQRNPELQSYKTGGGDGKAADPEQNVIIENDPRYERGAAKD